MSLNSRVALVTGGGRGIGRAISLGLAADGADVAIIYRRDEAAARDTAEQIKALGRRVQLYSGSVDDFARMGEVVGEIARDLGPVSILINNAGIASRGRTVHDTEPAEMEGVVRVHTFGPFYLSKLVLPGMRAAGRGDIVMISSVATRAYNANGSPYNMAKAATEALVFTMSKEENRHGIRVNVVAAPLTDTEMGTRLAKAAYGVKQNIHELDANSAFGRVAMPEDTAAMVRWLVSDANTYVSGQRIYVDGAQWQPARV
ncbi:MAG: SDR family NAD(P)-dependent oxidoreductase [Gammaproteobacteria bacterium]